jgi:hypothetical protein
MQTIINWLLGGAWQYVAAAVAGLAVLIGARRSGVNAERRKAAERAVEAMQTQREVENYVEGRSPADVQHDLTRWMRDDE